MKISIVIAILIVTLAIMTLPYSCRYIEQPHTYWETHSDSLHEGHWVPRIYPNDIVNIHMQHSIDTSEVWVRFNIGSTPIIPEQMAMEKLSQKQKEAMKVRKPFFTSWWFEGLIEQRPSNDGALHADVYRGQC